jgi:hypothetical protein
MYRQDVAQNSMASIVPDLATGWSWRTSVVLATKAGVVAIIPSKTAC